MREIIAVLKNTFLFENIKDEEIREILDKYGYFLEEYKSTDIIKFRGDEIDGVYIIIRGTVQTEMLKSSGEVTPIEILNKGDILASAFIFGNKKFFPVDIIAKNNVIILKIDKKPLVKLFQNNLTILNNFLNSISNKAQFLSKKVWDNFNNKTIEEKLNSYIKENMTGGFITLKVSIKELAEQFQVTRPSLSRALGNYVKDGILEKIDRYKYKILNKDYFIS